MVEHRTILIVDDEQTILESLTDIFALEGFQVLPASSGSEALEILREHQPDLIIADIMMPEMNGYQFYQRVRQSPNLLLIPFVFLTAKGGPEDVRYGKELGVDDYIQKPIRADDLISAVFGKLSRYEQLAQASQTIINGDEGRQADDLNAALAEALTPRELDVLRHMTRGMTNLEIAEAMFIEVSTVKTHVSNLLSKMGVSNRVEAVSLAMRSGVIRRKISERARPDA